MAKSIEDILKGMPLEQEVKDRLKESWASALSDAKVAQEARVREELATRYETDLERIHEAFSQYLEEKIKPHVEELQEGIQTVEKLKADHARKTAKIKEAAKAHVRARVTAMEKVIDKVIKRELSELHEDVVANRRAALKAINEKRAEMERDKQKFRAQGARVLEQIINVKLPKQLDELREDIKAAQQDNFGREIFEAFQNTFRTQFFESSGEFKKVTDRAMKLEEENRKIKARAAKVLREKHEEAEAAKLAARRLQESAKRSQTMARLLKNLSGETREQMKTILEATKTENLEKTYQKFYTQMIREAKKVPTKKKVNENRKDTVRKVEFRDGGTRLDENTYDPLDDEISKIRRLAGNA